MKIGILTFHRAINYGAALQARALCSAVGRFCDCELVDYRSRNPEFAFLRGRKGFALEWGLLGRAILSRFVYRKRRKKFRAFLDGIISEKTFRGGRRLRSAGEEYAAFITGGDQIWNPRLTGFDEAYLLGFAGDKVKKYSYAASTGSAEALSLLPESHLALIGRYSGISVRERDLAGRLSERLGLRVQYHLDPVFLMDAGWWSEIAIPPEDRGYLLYYELPGSGRMLSYAREASRKLGIRLVAVPYGLRRLPGIAYAAGAGPGEFAGLVQNAGHVVTNSYHGMALSILFQRPLTVEYPSGAAGERLRDLVSLLGLEDRVLTDEHRPGFEAAADYAAADRILSGERARAFSYLEEICRSAGRFIV